MHEDSTATIRDLDEIQRAHDMIHAIVTREVALDMSDQARLNWGERLGVLCWVLGHDSGAAMAVSLSALERKGLAAGFRLRRGPWFSRAPEATAPEATDQAGADQPPDDSPDPSSLII